MAEEHPNVALLNRLDLHNIAGAAELFAEDAVFHYFNPNLPDLQGDYVGLKDIASFFDAVGKMSEGSFAVEPVAITPVGDELVVTQTRNLLTFQGRPIVLDVVVVWRIVDGRIAEVWDIVPNRPSQA